MDEIKKIDKRENVRVVTDNSIIDAGDLSALSGNARKLLYIAISQCRKDDTEFYEYETTPRELAEMWGIDRSNVYRTADAITTELMKMIISVRPSAKSFKKRHLFETCDYDDNKTLKFKLHKEMSDLLLGIKRDYSQPMMWDFMKMRSSYSMAIWHLMQKEMKSFKPMMRSPIEFDLTLEELRRVTGCENKLKQIGQFKERVLDKAIEEIRRNCMVSISYTNVKRGRTITGFRFTAENVLGTMNIENISVRGQKYIRMGQLRQKEADNTITQKEYDELHSLILELEQMTLEDIANDWPPDYDGPTLKVTE